MANEFSKEELSKIKVKEDNNRANALKNSAKHDSEVINKFKSAVGIGQPAPAPAPVDTMGNVTGMKKGGKVSSKCSRDGIASKGLTKGRIV